MSTTFQLDYLKEKLRVWMQGEGYRSVGTFSVQGYNPDLIGLNADGNYANGEIKTPDKFGTERTKNKLKAFGTAKDNNGKLIPLYIAVPKGHEDAMRKVVENLLNETAHIKIKGF